MTVVPIDDGIPEALRVLNASRTAAPPSMNELFLYLLGLSGTGKSTLCASLKDWLFVDLEGGAHSIEHSRAFITFCPVLSAGELTPQLKSPPPGSKRRPATSFDAVMRILDAESRKPVPCIRGVILDSSDKLQDLMRVKLEKDWGHPIEEHRGGKGGWGSHNSACVEPIDKIRGMGYGLVLIGHMKMEYKEVGNTTQETARACITPGFDEAIRERADYVLGIGCEDRFDTTLRKKVKQYELVTELNKSKKGSFDYKKRAPLPPVIPNIPLMDGMSKFEEAYNTWANAASSARATSS